MIEIECRPCQKDTKKRVVIKRNPLKEIDSDLPDGYKEYYCSNIIKSKRKISMNEWFEEECRNHIIVKKIKKDIEKIK